MYERTRTFPKDEIYGLTSQLRRVAYSVPANIVEGSARESKREYLQFLYISRSSLAETQYFIHLAHRLGYLNDAETERLRSQTKQLFGCLHGLIQSVEKESGKVTKVIAAVTSLFVIALARLAHGPAVS